MPIALNSSLALQHVYQERRRIRRRRYNVDINLIIASSPWLLMILFLVIPAVYIDLVTSFGITTQQTSTIRGNSQHNSNGSNSVNSALQSMKSTTSTSSLTRLNSFRYKHHLSLRHEISHHGKPNPMSIRLFSSLYPHYNGEDMISLSSSPNSIRLSALRIQSRIHPQMHTTRLKGRRFLSMVAQQEDTSATESETIELIVEELKSSTEEQTSKASSEPSTTTTANTTVTSTQVKKSIEITTEKVLSMETPSSSFSSSINDNKQSKKKRKRKKYKRKRPKTQSEKERDRIKQTRQRQYEQLIQSDRETNIWAFESLFPAPGWDEETIYRDLYEVADRDAKIGKIIPNGNKVSVEGSGSNLVTSTKTDNKTKGRRNKDDIFNGGGGGNIDSALTKTSRNIIGEPKLYPKDSSVNDKTRRFTNNSKNSTIETNDNMSDKNANSTKVDRSLTRMVEDRLYGFRRGQMGDFEYDTSLMGDGAVKFRDGIRLGNALKINADRLTYFAKREMIHGKLEEAEELYEMAIKISPIDGRPYLGLAKIFERRRDFKSARDCLRAGIAKSRCEDCNGANPFLLQALGNLEEKMGHLSEAENLYIDAAKSRPSHAAAWVSLAQLRTRKLRQAPAAGRICYQTAERELKKAGLPKSSFVYTAWAALEFKAGETRKARELFRNALDIDPKCSAAWLQLGVMEANEENWTTAKECFEAALKFDKRNSRVLQAYALMETKRPDGDSRVAIGLFEKALKANGRDGGVLQAYALYVAKLGDIDSARELLRKGTEIDKRHAPLWQAWGVLETRHGTASDAREVFQQGIWACAQSSGGQSGGRRCARLWQAWGVLEAQEKDHAAARRCFSRALDADNRNVAAITAWTQMEKELGQYNDAKLIFEGALRQFTSFSNDKMAIWRAYELMEADAGNAKAAQNVYQRSIRDSLGSTRSESITYGSSSDENADDVLPTEVVLKKSGEVEFSRWNSEGFGESAVWVNDGSIEGKVPASTMNKEAQKPKK